MILHYEIKRQIILFSWNFKIGLLSSSPPQKWNGFSCAAAVPGKEDECPAPRSSRTLQRTWPIIKVITKKEVLHGLEEMSWGLSKSGWAGTAGGAKCPIISLLRPTDSGSGKVWPPPRGPLCPEGGWWLPRPRLAAGPQWVITATAGSERPSRVWGVGRLPPLPRPLCSDTWESMKMQRVFHRSRCGCYVTKGHDSDHVEAEKGWGPGGEGQIVAVNITGIRILPWSLSKRNAWKTKGMDPS